LPVASCQDREAICECGTSHPQPSHNQSRIGRSRLVSMRDERHECWSVVRDLREHRLEREKSELSALERMWSKIKKESHVG